MQRPQPAEGEEEEGGGGEERGGEGEEEGEEGEEGEVPVLWTEV